MILGKHLGCHHLTTYLLQPNLTLLHKITTDLTKVRGLRHPMTPPCTTRGDPQGDAQPVYNDLTAWRLNQGHFSIHFQY